MGEAKFHKKNQASQDAMKQLIAKMPLAMLSLIAQNGKQVAAKKQNNHSSNWDAANKKVAEKNMSGRLSGHGMNVDTETYQKFMAEDRDDGRRTAAGLKSVGYKWAGFAPATIETAGQAIKNHEENKNNQEYIQLKKELNDHWYNKAYHGHEMDLAGRTDDLWQGINKLEKQADGVKIKTPVDQSKFGQRMMAKSRELQEEATEGLTGLDQFLANAAIETLGDLPAAGATAVNPFFGAAVGGMMTTGEKSSELNAHGVDPAESLMRGTVSAGIDLVSDKIPVKKMIDRIPQGRRTSPVIELLGKNEDRVKDSANYAMNYLADLAAQDPNATFSLNDLMQSVATSALASRGYDAAGSAIQKSYHKASSAIQGRQGAPRESLNPYDYLPRRARLPYAR
jgi:hypothetical protein